MRQTVIPAKAGIHEFAKRDWVPACAGTTVPALIRFSHCDPAGIVYFVNFFDMVGLPFREMHLERRIGFPIVNTGCEFFRPAHLARALLDRVVVRGSVGGEEKFRARHKVALVSLDTWRALPIPEDVRAKMQPFVL